MNEYLEYHQISNLLFLFNLKRKTIVDGWYQNLVSLIWAHYFFVHLQRKFFCSLFYQTKFNTRLCEYYLLPIRRVTVGRFGDGIRVLFSSQSQLFLWSATIIRAGFFNLSKYRSHHFSIKIGLNAYEYYTGAGAATDYQILQIIVPALRGIVSRVGSIVKNKQN